MADEFAQARRTSCGDYALDQEFSSMSAGDVITVANLPINGRMLSLAASSNGATVQPLIDTLSNGLAVLFYEQDTAAQRVNSGNDSTAYSSSNGTFEMTVGGTASGNTIRVSLICESRHRGA